MTSKNSRITIHMVSSLDGFIASKDGSVSWLQSTDKYEKGIDLTKEKVKEIIDSIDCYVMGSKTYEQALDLGWPYGDKPVFVLTHRKLKSKRSNVEFYEGDLVKFINADLKSNYKNIWMVGGAKLAKDFIQLNIADEIIISIMPVILGEGLLFFDDIKQEHLLHLKDVTAYKDGMVELWYEIKKD